MIEIHSLCTAYVQSTIFYKNIHISLLYIYEYLLDSTRISAKVDKKRVGTRIMITVWGFHQPVGDHDVGVHDAMLYTILTQSHREVDRIWKIQKENSLNWNIFEHLIFYLLQIIYIYIPQVYLLVCKPIESTLYSSLP